MPALTTAFGQGTNAARPAASSSNNGYCWFSSDVNGGTLYQSNGSSWVQIGMALNGPMTAKGDLIAGGASGAATRLAAGTDAQALIADSTQTLGVKWGAVPAASGGALTNLGETILGSDTASITFSSISASYRNLHLALTGRSDQSDLVSVGLRFNADSGSNYDWTDWYNPSSNGTGSPSLEAVVANSVLRLGYVSGTNAPSNGCGTVQAIIYDYARTTWRRNVTSESQCERTLGATYRFSAGGTWRSTAAVTSLTLVLSAGNFKTGTVCTLWGAA